MINLLIVCISSVFMAIGLMAKKRIIRGMGQIAAAISGVVLIGLRFAEKGTCFFFNSVLPLLTLVGGLAIAYFWLSAMEKHQDEKKNKAGKKECEK